MLLHDLIREGATPCLFAASNLNTTEAWGRDTGVAMSFEARLGSGFFCIELPRILCGSRPQIPNSHEAASFNMPISDNKMTEVPYTGI